MLLAKPQRLSPHRDLQRLREHGHHRVRGSPARRLPGRTSSEYLIKPGTSTGRRLGAAALALHEAKSSPIISSDTLIAYARPCARRSKASNPSTAFTQAGPGVRQDAGIVYRILACL
jgi:hypothetical protein